MHDPELATDARRWLRYAQQDVALASHILQQRDLAPRESCWLAQQGTEKALKAFLVYLGVDFRRTHDLDALCTLLPPDSQTQRTFPDLGWLTGWAVEGRYPGNWLDGTLADARQAVGQALAVLRSVTDDLARRGLSPDEEPKR